MAKYTAIKLENIAWDAYEYVYPTNGGEYTTIWAEALTWPSKEDAKAWAKDNGWDEVEEMED